MARSKITGSGWPSNPFVLRAGQSTEPALAPTVHELKVNIPSVSVLPISTAALGPMKKRITSFAPVAESPARMLILGSMPGAASLSAGQYYAHPRNAFWKIMGELVGFDAEAPYAQRLNALVAAGIALWDVVHSCQRQGSLDTAIESSSIKVNDFVEFFCRHPHIKVVCFNGAAAERCYRKHVLPQLQADFSYARLPSTSPAHAAVSFERKLASWRQTLAAGCMSTFGAKDQRSKFDAF